MRVLAIVPLLLGFHDAKRFDRFSQNRTRVDLQPVLQDIGVDATEIEVRVETSIVHFAEIRRLSQQSRTNRPAHEEEYAGVAMVCAPNTVLGDLSAEVGEGRSNTRLNCPARRI